MAYHALCMQPVLPGLKMLQSDEMASQRMKSLEWARGCFSLLTGFEFIFELETCLL